MAGHSKFNNIKHRKGAQDKRRAKQFARLTREIITAAAQGGSDAGSNARLRTAMQNARACNMPKENIKRAISKSSDRDATNYEEIRYEGFGVGGVGLIIEVLSDNRNRAASSVRTALSKNGGNLGESNVVAFMFNQMGELFYTNDKMSPDDALTLAVETDIDETYSTDEGHFFFCSRDGLEEKALALEKQTGHQPHSQRLAWFPTTLIEVDEDAYARLSQLLEALEELDDVRYVFTNAAADGEPLFNAP
jgi:YebC/PmpR family DNA-binding regulatory protein